MRSIVKPLNTYLAQLLSITAEIGDSRVLPVLLTELLQYASHSLEAVSLRISSSTDCDGNCLGSSLQLD